MDLETRNRMFRNGLALCRRGALTDAAGLFLDLVNQGSDEPLHLAYCGLLTATVHGRRAEGRALCDKALRFGADEPRVVLSVARMYERIGETHKAIHALREGLRARPGQAELLKQIDRLSPRRPPPLSMLDRNHVLNKGLAILLAKASGHYEKREPASTKARKAQKLQLATSSR